MITKEFAYHFAQEWVDGWNAHDLENVLSHYTEEFEMNSPIIVARVGKPDGKLVGKEQVKAYWAAALQALPNLHFQLNNVFIGTTSVTLLYVGASGGMVTETFIFNDRLQVTKAYANYA